MKIHLTDQDLVRMRFSHIPSPAIELPWALRCLASNEASARFGEFRRAVRSRLDELSPFTHMDMAFDLVVKPYWPSIVQQLNRERMRHMEIWARAGIDGVLETLCPGQIRWNRPFLEIKTNLGISEPMSLNSRTLLVVPSFFCWRAPVLNSVPGPTLVYPVSQDLGCPLREEASAGTRCLEVLLGATRAALLRAVGEAPGVSTGELARRLNVSLGSASQHATVLTQAGIVVKTRDRSTVRHGLTALGHTLLFEGTWLPG